MRREADSQVNISLYLKKPEHILQLLLIFTPTSVNHWKAKVTRGDKHLAAALGGQ